VYRLRTEVSRLKDAYHKTASEIDQTLGRALGYPRYRDDQKNFPGTTDADGVCTGDHVPESLAAEAAKAISRLRQERDEALKIICASVAECSSRWSWRVELWDTVKQEHYLATHDQGCNRCKQSLDLLARTQSTPVAEPQEPSCR
jgi:hypothetical protein